MMALGLAAGAARGETTLARVLKPYESIQSLSCEIRRDTPLPGGEVMRMHSQVFNEILPSALKSKGFI